jgi:hypothetical protein
VSEVGRDVKNAALARFCEPASQIAPRTSWRVLVAFSDTIIANIVGQGAAVAAEGVENKEMSMHMQMHVFVLSLENSFLSSFTCNSNIHFYFYDMKNNTNIRQRAELDAGQSFI